MTVDGEVALTYKSIRILQDSIRKKFLKTRLQHTILNMRRLRWNKNLEDTHTHIGNRELSNPTTIK